MKKIFLFLCLALVTLVANAGNSPYDTKEKVIDRAKAIVAYHVVAQNDGKFSKDPLKERPKDVDVVLNLIENKNSKYESKCKEIKREVFDALDKASLIDQFNHYLTKCGVKGKNFEDASDQIKRVINGSDYPFKEKESVNGKEDGGGEVEDDAETVSQGILAGANHQKIPVWHKRTIPPPQRMIDME